MTKKITATEKRAASELQPLIDYVESQRGLAVEIAKTLTKRTRKKVWAGNVREWLDPDPKTRKEMRYGMGLLLLDLWLEIKNTDFR